LFFLVFDFQGHKGAFLPVSPA